jgi:cell division protein FtsZ
VPTQKEEMKVSPTLLTDEPVKAEPAAEIEISPEPKAEETTEEIRFELKIEEEEIYPLDEAAEELMDITPSVNNIQDEEAAFDEENTSPFLMESNEITASDDITEQPANAFEFFEMHQVEESSENDEQEAKIEKQIQRIKELKNLNVTLNSPGGIRDLEKEPAYKRKNKKLNDVPHSSESQISRLTLFDDNNRTGLRTNNSFLHDNVD